MVSNRPLSFSGALSMNVTAEATRARHLMQSEEWAERVQAADVPAAFVDEVDSTYLPNSEDETTLRPVKKHRMKNLGRGFVAGHQLGAGVRLMTWSARHYS